MSTFKKFDPEKPPADGHYIVSAGALIGQAIYAGGPNPGWLWLVGNPVVGPVSYHPLPTPDDGMVMVPEEWERCPEPLQQKIDEMCVLTMWDSSEIWAEIINHFKEANQ